MGVIDLLSAGHAYRLGHLAAMRISGDVLIETIDMLSNNRNFESRRLERALLFLD